MDKETIVIVGYARTPQGNLLGCFKDISASQLGSIAIQAAVAHSSILPEKIDEVMMGCVLPAGQGQAPARQAALAANLLLQTQCTTINKMCGSGMKAIMLAHDSLLAGSAHIIVAGGMESMTQAPYLLPKGREGYRLGHGELLDHLMVDGLEDAYEKRKPMGYFAEQCAAEYGFTRAQQDQYAITSLERAQKAIREKSFATEIAPVTIKEKNGEQIIDTDEHPLSVKIEKIPTLAPIFMKEGSITAANSCSIADGAAAVVLMTQTEAEKLGVRPLAKIIAHSTFAKAPNQFTTAPIDAIKRLLKKTQWAIDQVDLFEINEAFAVVAMAAMHDLAIPHEKLNIHGGGCALGHPIGATGARIVVTLLAALEQHQLKRGIAALCIGGGEATAIAIERCSM
jgi:acetyl-CoA C-acetyltransferase